MKRRVPSFRFNSFSNSTPGSDLPSLSEGKTTLHSKVIGYTPPAVQEVELSFVPLCLNCVDRLDPAKSTRSRIGDSLDERVPFTTLDPSSSSSLSVRVKVCPSLTPIYLNSLPSVWYSFLHVLLQCTTILLIVYSVLCFCSIDVF